ncbi:MAG TPA: hypothetical protein VNG51_01780 [Ktedonobacteraceae bacterium]|nr:hypothetical protein [Ktedonobacteraceae bacterium]
MREVTACQYCGRPIVVTKGHRSRAYCDDRCKMAAFRLRQEQAEREQQQTALRAQFGGYDEKTLQLLDAIMQRGNVELAQRVAWAINAEAGKQVHTATRAATQKVWELQKRARELEDSRGHVSEQNVQECQQKLTQAGQRIGKLEGQVAIQRQRLGQYYQHVAQLEQELARYREMVEISDRARLERQLYDIGEQIGYRQFIPADHLFAVGHGEEFWRTFAESASDEELVQAIVRVKYYAQNLLEVSAQAEVYRLRSRIRELEKQSSPPGS